MSCNCPETLVPDGCKDGVGYARWVKTCKCGEDKVWEDFVGLLVQMECLIERKKLHRAHTTADLRKAGKRVLCVDKADDV